jgi:hypothetical protein
VIEFIEIKAVMEAETQTAVKTYSRRSQTHLSSTMKDPEIYQKEKEVGLIKTSLLI